MNRIFCLWFPRWPLERLLAVQPELAQQPLLLYEQTPQGSLRVVAATDPAARPGMPLAEAVSLSAAHLEFHDSWADRQALVELAEACRRFSPTVGIEDVPRPDCLFLDLTGLESLYGSEAILIEQVLRFVRDRGYTPRAAVAETIGAAWGLAHFGSRTTDFGLEEALHSALCSLPLAALRLAEQTLVLLGRLGLRRVGQVETLPREALPCRFGPQLLLRLDQMFGRAAEALLTPRVAPQLAAEWSFEAPVEDRETLAAVCRALLEQVARPLAARREGVVRLECRFDCPPAPPAGLTVGLFRASASAEHLGELLRLRLESLRLSQGVSAVHLAVLASAPLAWQQRELFATSRGPDTSPQAALLIDRLSNRLGRQAVVRPILVSDAQPEYACVYLPWAGESGTRAAKPQAGKRRRQVDARPVCLERSPRVLEQVWLTRRQAPRAIRLGGREYRLVKAWGPERIETGWWRSGLVRRDYYRVQTTAGSRYWIYHDLRSNRWFLHGEF